MKPSETLNSCPLPISTTQTARGLLRIYARLKGELVKQRSGEDVMMEADEATRSGNTVLQGMHWLKAKNVQPTILLVELFERLNSSDAVEFSDRHAVQSLHAENAAVSTSARSIPRVSRNLVACCPSSRTLDSQSRSS